MGSGHESVVECARRLRAEIATHKRAMRQHREQLQAAASALSALEADSRRRGITLIIHSTGEGALHGQSDDRLCTESPD